MKSTEKQRLKTYPREIAEALQEKRRGERMKREESEPKEYWDSETETWETDQETEEGDGNFDIKQERTIYYESIL